MSISIPDEFCDDEFLAELDEFLTDGGYDTLSEWMEDSGYIQTVRGWHYPLDYADPNVAGLYVEPYGIVYGAMEAAAAE